MIKFLNTLSIPISHQNLITDGAEMKEGVQNKVNTADRIISTIAIRNKWLFSALLTAI